MSIKTASRINFTAKVFIFCLCLMAGSARAQYVVIPDSGFASWLSNNGYFQCLNGNMLDTACPAVLNAKYINISYTRVDSLDGIQYFKNLDSLRCNADTVLRYIPSLPPHLILLECRNDSLSFLPLLPDSLTWLACEANVLTALPPLPSTLQYLTCYNNLLGSLPPLPAALRLFYCSGNQVDSLPPLPDSLTFLSCFANRLDKLPVLPNTLQDLLCSNNLLQTLPALPSSLQDLDCNTNAISQLPALPDSLNYLGCYHNHLTTLPALPASLTSLNCEYNNLSSLPDLPDSLYQLFCDNNPNLKCLPLLNTIWYLEFYNTGVECVPEYGNVYISEPALTSLPLCDSTNNTNGCMMVSGIKGVAIPLFSIYPNPAKDEVMITVGENAIGSNVKISDVEGREIMNFKLQTPNSKLQTQNWAPGLYFVQLARLDVQSTIKKLIIE